MTLTTIFFVEFKRPDTVTYTKQLHLYGEEK